MALRTAAPPRATADRVPPHLYFVVSATFHYLGPAFAVLLFARVDVLGVAWLRIAAAALVFALWRRPWHALRHRTVLAWGAVLALMNCCFYSAIDRLPLATVAAIEFLPVIALAALGARTRRNAAALALAVAGVSLLPRRGAGGCPAHRRAPGGGAAGRGARAGQRSAVRRLHRARPPRGQRPGDLRHRRPRRRDARRARRRHAAGGLGRRPRADRPGRAAGRRRRRHRVLGRPLRGGPGRDGAAHPRRLC